MKHVIATVIGCLVLGGLAACGSSDDSGGGGGEKAPQGFTVPKRPTKAAIGQGEGHLNLIAWAGYAEDGSTDKSQDWVHPFEKKTGCQTNVKVANTSDEMITLMRTGQYDGVSASGNASVKLIAGGDVVPIDPKILTNWNDLSDNVKLKDYN